MSFVAVDASLYALSSSSAVLRRRGAAVATSSRWTLLDALRAEQRQQQPALRRSFVVAARQPPPPPYTPSTRLFSSSLSSRSRSSSTASTSSGSGTTRSEPTSTPPTSPGSETPSHSSSSVSSAPQPKFRFSIAASFLGKPAERGSSLPKPSFTYSPDSPVLAWRTEILTKQRNKSVTPGDDFFFTLQNRRSGSAALGVADGVGGWSESGVDPSIYATALMYHAQRSAEQLDRAQAEKARKAGKDVPGEGVYPHDVLQQAYDATAKEEDVLAGSSTATIITLNASTGQMRAANLGDSSFSLVRNDKIVHLQPPQQIYFNAPYQLSKLPASMASDPNSIQNVPSQADLFETRLQDGDMLICATDGFGDNVFPNETEILLGRIRANEAKLRKQDSSSDTPEDSARNAEARAIADQKLTQHAADSLVNYAKLCSDKEDKKSPFEVEAAKHGLRYRGGKVDDICIIVALVRAL